MDFSYCTPFRVTKSSKLRIGAIKTLPGSEPVNRGLPLSYGRGSENNAALKSTSRLRWSFGETMSFRISLSW
jgi:hypothetical protein